MPRSRRNGTGAAASNTADATTNSPPKRKPILVPQALTLLSIRAATAYLMCAMIAMASLYYFLMISSAGKDIDTAVTAAKATATNPSSVSASASASASSVFTGFSAFDDTLHMLNQLFRKCWNLPAGRLAMNVLFTLPLRTHIIDALRPSTHLWCVPAYVFIYQLFGISVFMPLVMAYYAMVRYSPNILHHPNVNKYVLQSNMSAEQIRLTRSKMPVTLHGYSTSAALIGVISDTSLYLWIWLADMDPTDPHYNSLFMFWIVFPCVMMSVPMWLASRDAEKLEHSQVSLARYIMIASLMLQGIANAFLFWRDIGNHVFGHVASVDEFFEQTRGAPAVMFIFGDALIVVLVFLMHEVFESGLYRTMYTLLIAATIGPSAALCFFFAQREKSLGDIDRQRMIDLQQYSNNKSKSQ
jgi:hypothetical protein